MLVKILYGLDIVTTPDPCVLLEIFALVIKTLVVCLVDPMLWMLLRGLFLVIFLRAWVLFIIFRVRKLLWRWVSLML